MLVEVCAEVLVEEQQTLQKGPQGWLQEEVSAKELL